MVLEAFEDSIVNFVNLIKGIVFFFLALFFVWAFFYVQVKIIQAYTWFFMKVYPIVKWLYEKFILHEETKIKTNNEKV